MNSKANSLLIQNIQLNWEQKDILISGNIIQNIKVKNWFRRFICWKNNRLKR